MPTLTISGINRSTLVSRPREGASSRHDAARAIIAGPSGTSRPNPMSQLAERMRRSELLSDRSRQDPAAFSRPVGREEFPSRFDEPGMPSVPRQPVTKTTAYVTERDLQMASRQTRIESLPPEQRQEQEAWAQKMLKRMPSTCPYGVKWKCVKGGYRCGADVCFVTDELLAEGKGGRYECPLGHTMPCYGPVYPADTALKNSQKRETRSSYVSGKTRRERSGLNRGRHGGTG